MQEIDISKIKTDGGTQVRLQLDFIAISEYKAAMQDGAQFPPIDVFFDGDVYWLSDGFHRVDSALGIGRTSICANVQTGGKREAILHAAEKSKQNNTVRLTSKDKRHMVEMFLNDAEWAEWSDVAIAEKCGISHMTVNRVRNTIFNIVKDAPKPKQRKYTRNGKTHTMNTANIGKAETETEAESGPSLFDDTSKPIAEPEQTDTKDEYEVQADDSVEDAGNYDWTEEKAIEQPETIAKPEPEVIETEPFTPTIAIINADAQYINLLDLAPVHLVVTSPPYNVGIDYDISIDNISTYIQLITAVWKQCYKVMVDGARIAVVVPFGLGRNPYIPFDCQVMQTMVDAGFTLRGRIIWDKGTTGNRTSWGSFRLPSDPGLRDTTECIIVAHKGQSKLDVPQDVRQKDDKGTHTNWLKDSDEFMALAQDHWVIAPESAKRIGHPAPFPVKLAENLIKFYAYPGAHVLDPFGGSGSVGIAAKRLGCNATLVDISAEYCSLAEERCK